MAKKPKTRQGGLGPAEIKLRLTEAGLTYADLDRSNGLPEGTCRNAARRPHAEGEQAIAAALTLRPGQIWPDRYEADGTRKRPQPARHYKPRPMFGHRQKEARA